jgi:hypothetical protein
MPVSTPLVPLDTIQRRRNIRNASTTPRPMANRPRTSNPRGFELAIGPSITALVTSGITIAAPIPMPARKNITMKRARYGRR